MKAQHENLLMESFGLWLDNTILTKGEAFYHYTGLFYEVSGNYANNTKVWAAPFKQAIADQNVNGIIKPIRLFVSGYDIFNKDNFQNQINTFDFDNSQVVLKGPLTGQFTGTAKYLYHESGSDLVGQYSQFVPNGTRDHVIKLDGLQRAGKVISGIYINEVAAGGEWSTFNSLVFPIGIKTGNATGLYINDYTGNLNLAADNLTAKLYLTADTSLTQTQFTVSINYGNGTSETLYALNSVLNLDSVTGSISGAFSFKEFGVKFTNLPEEQLLFETRHKPDKQSFYNGMNNTAAFLTNKSGLNGLTTDKIPYSVIYIRNNGGYNEDFQFGGTVATQTNVRAIILSDSLYNLDAISNILKDQDGCYVPIIQKNEMPFNQFGFPMSGVSGYNYGAISSGLIPKGGEFSAFIKSAKTTNLTSNSRILNEFQKLNPNIYPGFVDFVLESYREPV